MTELKIGHMNGTQQTCLPLITYGLDDFRATVGPEGSLKFRTAAHLAFDDGYPHAACYTHWCVHEVSSSKFPK